MTEYVLRLVSPDKRESRADVATAVNLMKRVMQKEPVGPFLVSSDPNGNGGRGKERWAPDISKAKRFPSQEDAMDCWRKQSTVRPFRPDGQPNRPMTAYSVVVEEIKNEGEGGLTILSAG